MTPAEFYMKCEWEGGTCEGILGYGLTADDLDDSDPELKAAVHEFSTVAGPLLEKLQTLLFKYEDNPLLSNFV